MEESGGKGNSGRNKTVLVGNSVLEEGQPVSEQHGLYVDWKGIPTAGGRKRKKRRNERYRKVQSLR